MRKEIENWFKTDRQFETGAALLMKYSPNLMLKASLQRGAISINILQYELAKLIGVSEPAYKGWLAQARKAKIEEIEEVVEKIKATDEKEVDVDALSYADALELAKKLDIEIVTRKKAALVEALKEYYEKKK